MPARISRTMRPDHPMACGSPAAAASPPLDVATVSRDIGPSVAAEAPAAELAPGIVAFRDTEILLEILLKIRLEIGLQLSHQPPPVSRRSTARHAPKAATRC